MKSPFKSTTIWFNILTALVTIATAYGYVPNDSLQGTVSGLLIIVAPLVNIGLRYFKTRQPLK